MLIMIYVCQNFMPEVSRALIIYPENRY